VQGQFPGYVALWPLVAAALVILAGQTGSALGADRILSSRPLVQLGDLSYALYLWHWPVLVLALTWQDRPSPGLLGGLLVIAVSLVLAYATMRFIERPLRALAWADRRRRGAALVLVVCLGAVAGPLALWQQSLRIESEQIAAEADVNNPGALALDPRFGVTAPEDAPLIPAAKVVSRDWVSLPDPCTGRYSTDAPLLEGANCSVVVDQEKPDRTIVAVGNSHVQQWLAAITPIAEESNWAVVAILKGGCQYVAYSEELAPECNEHNAQATDYILQLRPDAVFTTGTYSITEAPYELLPGGFSRGASDLIAQDIPVIAIRDNPRFSQNMAECVERLGMSSDACNPRDAEARATADVSPIAQMADITPGLATMDLDDYFCVSGTCPAVIGNVRVYMDDNHLSATYARTLRPFFEEQFRDATGW
jgi:hypothetical protein